MLIYTEDFSSPIRPSSGWSRVGGDKISYSERYHPDIVPYLEFNGHSYFDVVSDDQGVTFLKYTGNEDYRTGEIRSFLPRSKNLTIGYHLNLLRTKSRYDDDRASYNWISFIFESFEDHSETKSINFTVKIELQGLGYEDRRMDAEDAKKAKIYFTTGGEGFPDIPPETVYYDFNQPLTLWVQCDMTGLAHENPVGACRVWANNDLLAERTNIYTGNVNLWAETPLSQYNNSCYSEIKWGSNYSDRDTDDWIIYSVTALNEGLGYLTSALGDINMKSLAPDQTQTSQWEARIGEEVLEKETSEVFQENKIINEKDINTLSYAQGSSHLTREMLKYPHPFKDTSDIIAVAQKIVHKKNDMSGDVSNLRIEPVIQTSGRDIEMDRKKGQRSEGYAKTLFIPYNTPYAGAFWNEENLRLTDFGFTYFDAARPEAAYEQLDLKVEYDVENIDEDMGFLDFADARIGLQPEIIQSFADDGFSISETLDHWNEAAIGDYSTKWSWPHEGLSGYKWENDILVVNTDQQAIWGPEDIDVSNAESSSDGWNNCKAIQLQDSLFKFPATKVCLDLGPKYFLPASSQLYDAFSGISMMKEHLVGDYTVSFWSSTQYRIDDAKGISLRTDGSTTTIYPGKSNTYNIIAFRKPDEV